MFFLQVISADPELRHWFKKNCPQHEVATAGSLKEGLRNRQEDRGIDLYIVDLRLQRQMTFSWLTKLVKNRNVEAGEIGILLLAPNTHAAQADFFQKIRGNVQDIFFLDGEFSGRALEFFVRKNTELLRDRRALQILHLENEALQKTVEFQADLKKAPGQEKPGFFLTGKSAVSEALRRDIQAAISSDRIPLIIGEEGCEDESIARHIHTEKHGSRAPFVVADCAGIPEHLQETLIFGGKETGSGKSGQGAIDQAAGGSLLLRHLEKLPWHLQGKIYEAVRFSEYFRPGEKKKRVVRARLIFSGSPLLEKKVNGGSFRQDLFYRLHAAPIRIPSLFERREDIPLFAAKYAEWYHARSGGHRTLSGEILVALRSADYPGQIRELEQALEELFREGDTPLPTSRPEKMLEFPGRKLLVRSFLPEPEDRPAAMSGGDDSSFFAHLSLHDLEKSYIEQSLSFNRGNLSKTARTLRISRKTLYEKIKRYGIETRQA